MGWNSFSASCSSGSGIAGAVSGELGRTAMFMFGFLLSEIVLIERRHVGVESSSVPKACRHAAHQGRRRGIGQNAVVVDHDRRRQYVAQVAAHGELTVVAVAGK